MRQEGEPSVEEILESIKKVIARDNRETAVAERQRRESVGLRERFIDVPVDEDEGDTDRGVLELRDAEIFDEPEPEPPVAPQPSALLSAETERSMRESFAELAVMSETGPARPCGGTSIEGMVREMLKPMLAQWLDQNMPAIVERLVKAEIARLRG